MERNNYNIVTVLNESTGELENICLETGKVIELRPVVNVDKYRFNYDMANAVLQRIREGATLADIDRDTGLPPLSVVHYWRRSNASFDAEIKLARRDRAEYYHDRVLQLVDEVEDRDEIPVARFKVDQYKWAAEKGDPGTYGNKVEHSGSTNAATIVVVTGIKREEKQDIIEVVDEKEQIPSP